MLKQIKNEIKKHGKLNNMQNINHECFGEFWMKGSI